MSSMLFLSCSLRPEDVIQVNAYFERVFRFYGMTTQTINIPGISDEEVIEIIKEIIPRVDAVAVLWVPRYYIDGALPSIWTILETVMGLAEDKPTYIFHEENIALEGPLKSIGKMRVKFNRWSLSDPEEHRRLCRCIRAIKADIDLKKAEDSRNAVLRGLGILGGLALIFGLGFLIGAECSCKKNDS